MVQIVVSGLFKAMSAVSALILLTFQDMSVSPL